MLNVLPLIWVLLAPPTPDPAPVEVPPAEVPKEAPVSPTRSGPPPRFSEADPPTVGEAIEAGYSPRPKDEPAGSLSAGLLAIFPGILVHGLGHYWVDEDATALKLLLTEVLAVGMIAGAFIGNSATNNSGEYGGAYGMLEHYGWALFIGSWVADVVGAFKGAESFHASSARLDGARFRLAYRYTRDPRTTLRHHILTGLDLDFGWMYVRPEVDVEATLDARRYRVELGWRALQGENPQNNLGLGTRLRRTETPPFGVSTVGALGYVEARGDLGVFIRSLRSFYLYNRVGYGWEGTQLAPREDQVRGIFESPAITETYLTVESGMSVNSGPRTNVTVAVIVDETLDLAPITARGFLLDAALTHRYRDDLDIEFHFTAGDAFAVWLGLEYGL